MDHLLIRFFKEALSLRGRLGRGQFILTCGIVLAAQLPVLYVMLLTSGSSAAFGRIFDLVLAYEALMLAVIMCAMVRRVRDAGGNALLPFGLLMAVAILVIDSLLSDMQPRSAKGALDIATLAYWSFLGFSTCVGILLSMPSAVDTPHDGLFANNRGQDRDPNEAAVQQGSFAT